MHYNWIEDLLSRRNAEITFSPHVLDRLEYWDLDINKVKEAVRSGVVVESKCGMPYKLCLERYFGKENVTYVVIIWFRNDLIEVKTAWLRRGN